MTKYHWYGLNSKRTVDALLVEVEAKGKLVLCDRLMRPSCGLQSGSECREMLHHFVRIFETSMTHKLVRLPHPLWLRWHSGQQRQLLHHPFIPDSNSSPPLFFFFFLLSARCYFCCLFRSHFPPVGARPSMHPFQTLQSIPFGELELQPPARTVTSCLLIQIVQRSMFLREGIRLSTWLCFFFFYSYFCVMLLIAKTFGVIFNRSQLASPFRACMRAYKKTI